MNIIKTSISVCYKRIEEIKKVYYNNDAILKPFFNEATVLPVPDDAPSEIPRIIIKTLHEHAQLNISPIAATFEINYNDGFERSWSKCAEYINKRMNCVFEFLNLMTQNSYEYIGLISNVLYDEVQKNGAQKLSDTLLNSASINGIYDINIKYTFVENKNMFVNIMLQNARIFDEQADFETAGGFAKTTQKAESIGAIIDINDRYGFNNDDSYKSNSDMLKKLMERMTDIIDNKLSALIEKGVY